MKDADKDLDNMSKAVDDFGKRFTKLSNWVGGEAGAPKGKVEVGKILSGPQAALKQSEVRQPVSQTFGSAAASVNITNNISGVSDPKAAGEAAGKATKSAVDSKKLRNAFGAVGQGA